MVSHHGLIACKAFRCQPVTVIAAFHGLDSQFQYEVISGSKKAPLNPDFPEEGVYILYKNRALQIAGPPCDQRKCTISRLCRCNSSVFSNIGNLGQQQNSKRRATAWPMWKPCSECLFNWLRLHQATETANRLNMQCLQHPRALTLVSLNDRETFSYDGELEDESFRSNRNGNSLAPIDSKLSCSTRRFEWMCDAWSEFVNCGCCKPGSITAMSDCEEEAHGEYCSSSEHDNLDSDSDWDDLDIPCEPTRASSLSDPNEYDFIEDLIDEEFPKLRKSKSTETHSTLPSKVEEARLGAEERSFDEEEDTPAPVIVPPKDLAVGKGLRSSTKLASSISIPSDYGIKTSVADSQLSELHSAVTKKRAYCDLVSPERCDSQPAEDLSRAKQRKLDLPMPKLTDRPRKDSSVHKFLHQLDSVPQQLVFTT
ncbi:hypothetical protein F5Y05DRAFT_33776 [Hypoxylon sp. FL0543]|nr:hypothetical protein F5Y05DRAFT_33776 [Hypoxylon sp. FL0543]